MVAIGDVIVDVLAETRWERCVAYVYYMVVEAGAERLFNLILILQCLRMKNC